MGSQDGFLSSLLDPWYRGMENPADAQETVMRRLVSSYALTSYGRKFNADRVESMGDFRTSFPVVKYRDLTPYLDEVKQGNHKSLLSEPVVRWVMTRGTTGTSKIIPTTETHLSQILAAGARGILNFAAKRNDFEVLTGEVLNLNFPSEVGILETQSGGVAYGYSSGTYAKLNPELGATRLVPRQEDIDALGGGITGRDWENRFELVYQKAKDHGIKSLMGVTPVMTAFAKYVKRSHGVLPKDLWKLRAVFCTSVAKIQTSYAPYVRKLYGDVPVVELYTATEGVFAQQLDENPYVCPNYDIYLFEVINRKGIKMLHELERGEWGRLIISSCLFPRYDIGDLIESAGKGYFRIFGRARKMTVLEHIIFNAFTGRIVRA